jgi:hypothetical protein
MVYVKNMVQKNLYVMQKTEKTRLKGGPYS